MSEKIESKLPRKTALLAWVVYLLIRLIARTLRFMETDRAGILTNPPEQPAIWCIWHNSIFAMPWWRRHRWNGRPMTVLTSPSGDGAIIAAVCAKFGIGAVRGSSNKQGARALVELRSVIKAGTDVTMTPDGPRGPRYVIAPGIVKLALVTKSVVIPTHIIYEKAWRLKTWDGFYIPMPFSRVRVTYADLFIPDDDSESERKRLEFIMQQDLNGDEAGIGMAKQKRKPKVAIASSDHMV